MSVSLVKLKYVLPVALIVGTLLSVALLSRRTPTTPAINLPTQPDTKPGAEVDRFIHGKPVRLLIPSLNIDANVTHVGLTDAGDMDAPKQLMDAGWYKYGSHPGDEGSAVIAGHVGGVKAPGIFMNLHKLQKGERFSIIDDHGQTVYFTVRETKTYDHNDQPTEVFRGKDGKYMNLITCAGAWDDNKQTFKDRLVVFADKSD